MSAAAERLDHRLGHVRLAGYRPVTRGAHLRREVWAEQRPQLVAWEAVLPSDGGFSGLTAARLLGWPTPAVSHPVFYGLPHRAPRPRRPGLVVDRTTAEVVPQVVRGYRVVHPAQVVLHCARRLGVLDLVAIIDAALAAGHCCAEDLHLLAAGPWRGAPVLRQALRWVDPRSESPWETWLRMLLVSAHVAVVPQYEVRHEGRFVARADLWIRGTRRLMEYDGSCHRESNQHATDLARDARLLRLTWERFGYTAPVMLYEPASIVRDADAALGRKYRPERLNRWLGLVAGSSLSSTGRARLIRSWPARTS